MATTLAWTNKSGLVRRAPRTMTVPVPFTTSTGAALWGDDWVIFGLGARDICAACNTPNVSGNVHMCAACHTWWCSQQCCAADRPKHRLVCAQVAGLYARLTAADIREIYAHLGLPNMVPAPLSTPNR